MKMNLVILLVEVIMECVTTTSLKVLWNGEPFMSFMPSRRVRQGDPLSPYLFVICLERLSNNRRSHHRKTLEPIQASSDGPMLFNLFFANDIVFFTEVSIEQAEVVHDCLVRFCGASGQKVSHAKYRVYFSKNVESTIQAEIS